MRTRTRTLALTLLLVLSACPSEDPDVDTPIELRDDGPSRAPDMPAAEMDTPDERDMPEVANTPPTITLNAASPTTRAGVPWTITGTIDDPDPGDAHTGRWEVTSRTVDALACDQHVELAQDTSLTLRIAGDADPRCADELTVRWVVSDGTDEVTATAELGVAAHPGLVTSFVEMPGNPQPDIGGCPTWHCLNHSDPTLGRLPDGSLAIWAAVSGIIADNPYPNFPVVGRFVQNPDGTWTADADPSLQAADVPDSGWALARETPSVRWNAEAQAWDMWFLGYSVSFFDDPGIGQLRSLDPEGTEWGSSPAPIHRPAEGDWDADFLTSPGALQGSDGVWRLYYAGASFAYENGEGRIGVLTSTDGQTWTPRPQGPVFEGRDGQWDEGILDPHVQFVGGRYVMWYTGYVPPLDVASDDPLAIGVAESEDGYTWTRLTDAPMIAPIPDSWMDKRVLDVEVLPQADGSLLMTGYAESVTLPHPFNPDLFPGRIGMWRATP